MNTHEMFSILLVHGIVVMIRSYDSVPNYLVESSQENMNIDSVYLHDRYLCPLYEPPPLARKKVKKRGKTTVDVQICNGYFVLAVTKKESDLELGNCHYE